MTDPCPHRYYYRISSINVFECVQACSLTEAKQLAAERWLHHWHELEWVNVQTVTESVIYG